jgi:DNA-binding transcriptional MerR regulator
MRYDKNQIAEKLIRWENFMNDFRLPDWDELPRIKLYMDQMIGLITQFLGFFVYDPGEEKLLTPSMVNNYVKMRLLPPPVKKKYSRKHIALLIMICTFKQSLSMAAVEQMLPPDDEEKIRADYERFVASHKRLALYFIKQVKSVAGPIYDETSNTGTEVNDLVVGTAIASSFTRLLAGKIIALKLPDDEHGDLPSQQNECSASR